MSKNGAPKIHFVELVTDKNGPLFEPTFNTSTQKLVAFLQGRGEFLGMLDGKELNGALVNIDSTLAAELHEQDFVARLPIAGAHKSIHPLHDIDVPSFDEGKIATALTL
ncbi:MAG: hypothetical protein DYH13_10040 [Alphaproteobacteria bacterium PRO2]|nr:hypothetical protein [Alphaproteobacteria bacterium PRO2]